MQAGNSRTTPGRRISRIAVSLDDSGDRPRVWLAMLAGAGLGMAWGVAARIWMRLIATNPEFSIEGTAIILIIATLFGGWTGLAFAARRRGWRGWRHYLPRGIAVAFFIPFGFGGGMPLMITVLLATIALCQPGLVGAWVAALAIPLGAVAMGRSDRAAWTVAGIALATALPLTASAIMRRRRPNDLRLAQVSARLDRIGRALPLIGALGGFGAVAWEIARTKPGIIATLAILFYLILLVSLGLALRVALGRRRPEQSAA